MVPLHLSTHEDSLLAELMHIQMALIESIVSNIGISPTRLMMLHAIAHAEPDGIGLTDIAQILGVTPALISRQVKELEGDNLLYRSFDDKDKRRSFIHLTQVGHSFMRRFHERSHQFERSLCHGIDAENIAVTIQTLKIISENLESSIRYSKRPLDFEHGHSEEG